MYKYQGKKNLKGFFFPFRFIKKCKNSIKCDTFFITFSKIIQIEPWKTFKDISVLVSFYSFV